MSILVRFQLLLFGFTMMGPMRLDIYLDPYGNSLAVSLLPFAALFVLWLMLALPNRPVKRTTWYLLVCTPVFLLFLSAIWSEKFTSSYGGNFIFSVFAQRWLLLLTLVPIGIMLHERGVALRSLLKVTVASAVFLLLFYALRQLTWDLHLLASDPATAMNVRSDPLRGYRLTFPQYIYVIAFFYCLSKVLFGANAHGRLIALLAFILLTALYTQIFFRLHLVMTTLVLVTYVLVFHRRRVLGQLIAIKVFLTLGIPAFIALAPFLFDTISQDKISGIIRLNTLSTIVEKFPQNPLFGVGAASNRSISYQDVFGDQFFPVDVGLVGTAFTHGLTGAVLVVTTIACMMREAYRAWQLSTRDTRDLTTCLLWSAAFLVFALSSGGILISPDSVLAVALVWLFARLCVLDLRNQKGEPLHEL